MRQVPQVALFYLGLLVLSRSRAPLTGGLFCLISIFWFQFESGGFFPLRAAWMMRSIWREERDAVPLRVDSSPIARRTAAGWSTSFVRLKAVSTSPTHLWCAKKTLLEERASSRWHFSASLRASARFALASSMFSPSEIAAGISSTKQL